MGCSVNEEEKDEFPVGMRVLAVDDEPACLKLLEAMLRHCGYHVTTTNQAAKALAMLRESKVKFDLVISDVLMPDMDGFKLLELVGLEMDLPVIMMSAYSDTDYVMKGIRHGACDYMLKPVRIEELKTIWQHVITRRKDESRGMRKSMETDLDQTDKQHRKRKDQIYVDGEEGEDNSAHENEDLSTQKKARVVWSVDLHKKFVQAVDQLGIEKAFPKRILDLMNVEGLTRENVASHLQKYRIYLKKCGTATTPIVHMNPMTCYGEYPYSSSLIGSGSLMNTTALPVFQHSSASLIMDGIIDSSYARNADIMRSAAPTWQSLALDRSSFPLNNGLFACSGRSSGTSHPFRVPLIQEDLLDNVVQRVPEQLLVGPKEDRTWRAVNPETCFVQNDSGSLEDLIATMIKGEEFERISINVRNGVYPLGSCV